jgi:hypothetical protein
MSTMRFFSFILGLALVCSIAFLDSANPTGAAPAAPLQADALHGPLDEILDANVRDGLVYYRALQSNRGRLDRYAASLNVPEATYESWSPQARMAFWLNAYNTFVLQTVVNRYPIRGRSPDLPASSVRQIPGAFDTIRHRAAGRNVTLDEIEKTILPEFKEPRVFLALGRGAIGSGRLRSEAYTAERLEAQLAAVKAEFVTEENMLKVDRGGGRITVTSILSWNADHFIAAYDTGPSGRFAQRSPIERALVAFITPHLLPLEREFVEENKFAVAYHPFDWRLNDLTGGGGK